jgi:hypothetical protein
MSLFGDIFGALGIGGNSSSGNATTTPTLTPDQQAYLDAQTKAFTNTFLPAYQNTVQGANNIYGASAPYLNQGALQGFSQATNTAQGLFNPSMNALNQSSSALANIINPNYINSQIQGYLQPVMEQNREANNSLFAQYGGSGNLGSARSALAQQSLAGLNQARLQAAGTNAISNITGQQILAAQGLGGMGFQGLNTAQGANQAAVGFANAPTDLYSKYASVIFGVPQQSTVGNFTGTQGSTSSGSSQARSFNFGF